MIYFNGTNPLRTANYYVQQLFGQNAGDAFLPASITSDQTGANQSATNLPFSCVRDFKTGDVIIKLVNLDASRHTNDIAIQGGIEIQSQATQSVLAGDLKAFNTFANPRAIVPQTTEIAAGKTFRLATPAQSLTVVRLKSR